MKIEIWDDKPPEDEKVLRLRLIKSLSGNITLCAVDASGDRLMSGTLLKITPAGFQRCGAVSSEVPLPGDYRGYIMMDNE